MDETQQHAQTNAERYATLAQALKDAWEADWAMYTTDPASWQLIRQIDDWLVAVRDHPGVSGSEYQAQCDRLFGLFQGQFETIGSEVGA